MKKRNALLPLVVLLLVFLAFLVRRWNEPGWKEAFDRHPRSLTVSPSASCGMTCRGISREDISRVMEKGAILFHRSNKAAQPCPTFALQGFTLQGRSIRVFFAQCAAETTVLACDYPNNDERCPCEGNAKQPLP